MDLRILCFLGTVALASAGAHINDHGPHTFVGSTTPLPSPLHQLDDRPRKEFFLYLTHDQVKNLENAGAVVIPQNTFEPQIVPNGEPQVTEEQHEHHAEYDHARNSQLEEIVNLLNQNRIQAEHKEQHPGHTDIHHEQQGLAQQEEKRLFTPAESIQHGAENTHIPETEDWKPLQHLYYAYGRNEGSGEHYQGVPETENIEKVKPILEPYSHHQAISASIIEHRDRLAQEEIALHNKLHEVQYAPQYNEHAHAIEIEKWKSERRNARAKAEAFAKASTVFIREEFVKKNRPIEVVKHVEVPVPTPILVHVPQPYEVKVPQPYPVPLEIVRPFPVPIVKTQTIEVEKPVPVEIEKHVPVTVEKNVFVKINRPFLVQRIVPVEIEKQIPVEIPVHKPEKLTIIRHIWDH